MVVGELWMNSGCHLTCDVGVCYTADCCDLQFGAPCDLAFDWCTRDCCPCQVHWGCRHRAFKRVGGHQGQWWYCFRRNIVGVCLQLKELLSILRCAVVDYPVSVYLFCSLFVCQTLPILLLHLPVGFDLPWYWLMLVCWSEVWRMSCVCRDLCIFCRWCWMLWWLQPVLPPLWLCSSALLLVMLCVDDGVITFFTSLRLRTISRHASLLSSIWLSSSQSKLVTSSRRSLALHTFPVHMHVSLQGAAASHCRARLVSCIECVLTTAVGAHVSTQ